MSRHFLPTPLPPEVAFEQARIIRERLVTLTLKALVTDPGGVLAGVGLGSVLDLVSSILGHTAQQTQAMKGYLATMDSTGDRTSARQALARSYAQPGAVFQALVDLEQELQSWKTLVAQPDGSVG